MTTVLLRDDFTASTALIGRTPDGVSSGAWVDDAFWLGTAAGTSVISGGAAKGVNALSSWSVDGPLTGTPSDAYIQAHILIPGGTNGGVQLGLRNVAAGHLGVFVESDQLSSTSLSIQVFSAPNGVTGGTGTFTVVDSTNYVLRMEVQGTAIRIYLDGSLVLTAVLTASVPGGNAFMGLVAYPASFDYVEAGSLVTPVSPPFWGNYTNCFEIDS